MHDLFVGYAELPSALGGEGLRFRDGSEKEREPHEHGILFRGCIPYRHWTDLLRPSVGKLLPHCVFLHMDGQHCLPTWMVGFWLRRPSIQSVLCAVQLQRPRCILKGESGMGAGIDRRGSEAFLVGPLHQWQDMAEEIHRKADKDEEKLVTESSPSQF